MNPKQNQDTPLQTEKRRLAPRFDRAARRYDLMVGLNPGYRKHLRLSADRLDLAPDARILDLCCGTGLSTQALAQVYPDATIQALDFSEQMLSIARGKGIDARVSFSHGDAMDPEQAGVRGPFDGILMAYGIRNVPDPDACLERLRGLLRPGGRLCLHEYSVADSFKARSIFQLVSATVIVPAGLLSSGSTDIYRYLRRSVLAFDGVRGVEARLKRAGFENVHTLPMDGWQQGVLHSFVAERPLKP